jgi:ABC-type uncharacterized transport system ATPase subunit
MSMLLEVTGVFRRLRRVQGDQRSQLETRSPAERAIMGRTAGQDDTSMDIVTVQDRPTRAKSCRGRHLAPRFCGVRKPIARAGIGRKFQAPHRVRDQSCVRQTCLIALKKSAARSRC